MRLTQKAMAAELEMSQQALSQIEAGGMTIGAEVLWRMAQVLHTSVGYFCEGLAGPSLKAR